PIPEVKTQQQAKPPPNAPLAPPPPPFAAVTPAPPPPHSAPAEAPRPAETPTQPPEALPDPARLTELLALTAPASKPEDAAPPSDNAARLSASEVAAFKAHLNTCWAKPSVASDTKPSVAVRIALGPDGRLRGNPDILAVSSASSVDGPALVQSIMRALTQ